MLQEMLTVLTDAPGVCLSRGLNQWRCVQCTQRAVHAGSIGANIALHQPLLADSSSLNCQLSQLLLVNKVKHRL